jgi:hypothetical protein
LRRFGEKIIKPVDPSEEEQEFDHVPHDASNPSPEDDETATQRGSVIENSTKDFCALPNDILADAKVFDYHYGPDNDEIIKWQILEDGCHIGPDEDFLVVPEASAFKKAIAFDPADPDSCDYNKVFFDDFFPSIEGHARLMDEFYSDPSSPYYATVQADKIKFEDLESSEGPDVLVRIGYTLLIAAATEVHRGVDNLWKRGPSGGRHDYPDFGRYMQKNHFRAFLAAAPYCWCDKKNWYLPRDEKNWSIFEPVLNQFNEKRRRLLKVVLLMLDESMSGWRPKTSKLGGLPNYTFEPRKPIPLGTMFRNGVECMVGCLVHQDIVQLPEQQHQKKFHGETSFLPGRSQTIGAHTAEVLRQIENSGVIEGGWCGGDAWFGSVMTAVEVYRQLGVHSTFIVKNNHNMYPMQPLLAVLRARFGKRPAGHWVVFRAVIGEVKLFALAYAWSQRGISYFLSTCGRTDPHPQKYRSNFEDDFGVVTFKELNRPYIAHFLYEYLPLIDEHNKQRQNLLNLERSWLTKDCWMRLITTIVGMSVVDFQRCVKNHLWEYRYRGEEDRAQNEDVDYSGRASMLEDDEEIRIKQFSDKICKWLSKIEVKNRSSPRKCASRTVSHQRATDKQQLVRMIDVDGNTTRPPTGKQERVKGRRVGNAYTMNCLVCRMFLDENDQTTYNSTQWWCKKCHMPLCKKDRTTEDSRRTETCLEIHMSSHEELVFCKEVVDDKPFFIKKDLQIEYPRRSARRHN